MSGQVGDSSRVTRLAAPWRRLIIPALVVLAVVGIGVLAGSRQEPDPDADRPRVTQADREIDRVLGLSTRGRALARMPADVPVPNTRGRNPFVFAEQAPPPPSRVMAAPLPPAEAALPPPASLTLEGMADRSGPQGPRRIAVISDGRQLFLVGAGDAVGEQFEVARIESSFVELRDRRTGSALILRLK